MALQTLTLKLDGITAGDYLTWCRGPGTARARLRAAVVLHRSRTARGHNHRDPRLEPLSAPRRARRERRGTTTLDGRHDRRSAD